MDLMETNISVCEHHIGDIDATLWIKIVKL